LIWRGFKSALEYKDLWDLNPNDKSETLVPLFEKEWNLQLQKVKRKRIQEGQKYDDYLSPEETHKEKEILANIIPALLGAFGKYFLIGVTIKLIPDIMTFISPQILE
jgi:hypothetical protein